MSEDIKREKLSSSKHNHSLFLVCLTKDELDIKTNAANNKKKKKKTKERERVLDLIIITYFNGWQVYYIAARYTQQRSTCVH